MGSGQPGSCALMYDRDAISCEHVEITTLFDICGV